MFLGASSNQVVLTLIHPDTKAQKTLTETQCVKNLSYLIKKLSYDQAETFFSSITNPTYPIYHLVFKMLGATKNLERAKQVLEKMNVDPNTKAQAQHYNSVMKLAFEMDEKKYAQDLFESMSPKSVASYQIHNQFVKKDGKF